jgi:hypothetical protein
MKMQKRHWAIIFSLIVFFVGIEIFQYGRTFKENIVAAVQTIPNPGHSWAEMESGPDSIQVLGRTITNLAAPVASTDATNKAYVDASEGSSTYAECYVLVNASTCLSGWTAVATFSSSTLMWSFGGVLAGFPSGSGEYVMMGVGGSQQAFYFSCYHTGGDQGAGSACTNDYGGALFVYPGLDSAFVTSSPVKPIVLCCK